MSEHRSPWLANLDPPSWPSVEGDLETDVVVVGAGIAGLTVASLLAGDGFSVVVLEANRVGRGTTGHTTGKITSQHGLIYRELIDRHGEKNAAAYAMANEDAIRHIESTVAELGVDCGFRRMPSYVYTTDPRRRGDLEAEAAVAQRLGLRAGLTTDIDLPFPVAMALRFDDQAVFDVGPYMAALATRLTSSSGEIYEGSRAVDISEKGERVLVKTAAGQVTARQAVVTSLIPFMDRSGFFARMKPSRAYGVGALLVSGGLTGMHINADQPTRSTRPWNTDQGTGIVVVGEDHSVGNRRARPGRWGELERWARDHFDVGSFEYRWSSQDFETVDRMPYVGRAPLMTRTYVGTGFRKWGLTNATAAAHVIADLVAGRDNDRAEVFSARRVGDARALARTSLLNLHVASRFVGDRLNRLVAPSLDSLERGDGGLVRADGVTIAAYRDPEDKLHCVSPTCTHLGCTVKWNHAEKSWDCPCHGSRFDIDGAVLDGPATEPLRPAEVERDPKT
jgi:glycine/D-amino acid oxidase-like deaminating enzyme/nitrite reductase/ring-hydroxylating ferredoxin subunit